MKIICTDSHLIVYADKDVVESVVEITSFEKVSHKKYLVQSAKGEIEVTREDNCGCGNQLRGFHPYQGVPQVAYYPSLKGT